MTTHKIINCNSNNIKDLKNKSVHLIVTSPPYPMIEMWDSLFVEQNQSISEDLSNGDALNAFYKMHSILNSVWDECDRVLIDNGFVCINIGDATRTIKDTFQLFSNHTAIINYFISKGYSVLPNII
jgi:DNA modification methylase